MTSQTMPSSEAAIPDIDISSIGSSFGSTIGTSASATLYPSYSLLSHSSRNLFYSCPRKYHLTKLLPDRPKDDTIHTVFGKAVGIGIQSLCSGAPLDMALVATLAAWEFSLDYTDDAGHRSKKNAWYACQAVEQFAKNELADIGSEWAVFILPNGEPSIEVAFRIAIPGTATCTYERGFIDIVLQHRETKQLAVIELKTTATSSALSSGHIQYGNSGQGTSYGVVTDYLARQLGIDSNLMVFYITYYTKEQKWELYPFTKTLSERMAWLTGLATEHAMITTCSTAGVWPMNGSSCQAWGRPCYAFGTCNLEANRSGSRMVPDSMEAKVPFAVDVSIDQLWDMYRSK